MARTTRRSLIGLSCPALNGRAARWSLTACAAAEPAANPPAGSNESIWPGSIFGIRDSGFGIRIGDLDSRFGMLRRGPFRRIVSHLEKSLARVEAIYA